MQAQADIFEIACACLCVFAAGFNGSPDLAPEIYLVGELCRQNYIAVIAFGCRIDVGPVSRQLHLRAGWLHGHGRKQLRTRLLDQIPGAHVLPVRDLQILIGDCDRFFKRVELLVSIDLPPLALWQLILRTRLTPVGWRLLIGWGWRWHSGLDVLWADRAATQQHNACGYGYPGRVADRVAAVCFLSARFLPPLPAAAAD